MTSNGDITFLYFVTPDLPYPQYAAASIYSALRSNPGAEVRLVENPVPEGEFKWRVMLDALPGLEEAHRPGWLVILDADTWVNGPIAPICDRGHDISLRVANVYGPRGHLDDQAWHDILSRFGLPPGPVYSNGLIVCRWPVAVDLGRHLPIWMERIRALEVEDPLKIRGRPKWWMLDQFALSALVADRDWAPGELTVEDWSWNYAGEWGGTVHHLGKKVNPFREKSWPNYQKS